MTQYYPGDPRPLKPKRKKRKQVVPVSQTETYKPQPKPAPKPSPSPSTPYEAQQTQRAYNVLYQPGIPESQNLPSAEFYNYLQTPDPEYQSVQAQMDAITSAYRRTHGRDPSTMMMTILLTSTPPNTTVRQYVDLLAPTGEGADWRVPGSAELTTRRQELTPSKVLGWDEPQPDFMAPNLATGTGKPIGVLFNETKTPYGVNSALSRLRSEELRREWRDNDKGWFQRAMHDVTFGSIHNVKQLLADRELEFQNYMGQPVGLNFDVSDGKYDEGTDAAYRQVTFGRQFAYAVLGDQEQYNSAYKVMVGDEEKDEPGLLWDLHGLSAEGRQLIAKAKYLRSNIEKGKGIGADDKKLLFGLWMQGRPVGQSWVKGRFDYVYQFGAENLPADEQQFLAETKKNLGDFVFGAMNAPFQAVKDISGAIHNALPEGQLKASDYTVADWSAIGLPPIKGLDWNADALDLGAYVGDLADAVNGLVQTAKTTFLDVPGALIMGLESKGVQLLNVLGVASGTHVIDPEGKIVPNQAFITAMHEGNLNPPQSMAARAVPTVRQRLEEAQGVPGQGDIDWDVVFSAQAWAAARNSDQGKMLFREIADNFIMESGHDPADLSGPIWDVANTVIDVADLAGAIWLGKKAGQAAKAVAVPAGVKGFEAGRATYDYVKGMRERYAKEPGAIGSPGEWVLRVKKSDLDRLSPEVRAEFDRLKTEYEDIEQRAQGTYVPSASENAAITRRIKELGGIAGDAESNPFWDEGISYRENQAAFRGLARRIGGEPMDDVAQTIGEEFPGSGITDSESLWGWLNRAKEKVGKAGERAGGEAAAKRASDIEARVAYLLSNNRFPEEDALLNAPESMFATEEYIGEGQQAGLGIAIDETATKTAPVARLRERGPEQMPGQTAMETKPKPQVEVEGTQVDAQGVEVAPVTTAEGVVQVDATIAEANQWFNDNGFKTRQSHGGPEGHPAEHPTVKEGVQPYEEFYYKGTGRKNVAAIKAAAKRLGFAVEESVDKESFIVRGDPNELSYAVGRERPAEVQAHLEHPAGGAGAPPAGTPTAEPPAAPPPQGTVDYPWFLRTKAETIAAVTDPTLSWLVADMLKLTDDLAHKKSVAAAVEDMVASSDPKYVAMRIRELTGDEVDPGMPGLLYHLRVKSELNGAKANWPTLFRLATAYTAFDNDVSSRGTHRDVHNFATITKMGLEDMTPEEWRWVNEKVNEIWKTDDANRRNELIADVDARVRENMSARANYDAAGARKGKPRWTNEWEKQQYFKRKVYGLQAQTLLGSYSRRGYHLERRSYGPGDRPRVNYGTITRQEQQIAELRKQYESAAAPADQAHLKKALADADAELIQMREDAVIIDCANRGVKGFSWKSEKVRNAEDRWKRRSPAPQPVYSFQLRKNLAHAADIDPRILAIYQAGAAARVFELSQSSKWNLVYGNNVMRMWKSLVMSSLGFPIRVNAGDELWRLIPEGMGPWRAEFWEAQKAFKELFGARTLRGHHEALRAEEGTVGKVISDKLFDTMYSDYVEAVSKDWALVGPNEGHPHYVPAFRDFFRQLMEEPHFRAWREERPSFRDEKGRFDRAALEDFIQTSLTTSDEGVRLLTQTGRARVKDGHFYAEPEAIGDLVSAYADTMQKVLSNEVLAEAAAKGRITKAEMSQVNDDLWAIPVSIGIQRPFRAGVFTPVGFYENVTLPLMEGINYQLRGTFFSGFYLRESRSLAREHPEWTMDEVHSAAAERALDRVNKTTFTRNATVLEDLGRNVIPFISSYRQFAVYWLKVFGKYPFAMGAAKAASEQLALSGWFGPFWMQEDKYSPEDRKKGVIGQSIPGVNPFIGYLVGRATNWDNDIEYFPGMASAGPNYQPMNVLGNLYYAKTGQQFPLSRPVGTMRWRLRQYELWNSEYVPAPEKGATATAQVDGDWWYDLAKKLGFYDPLAANAWVRGRISPGGGTQVAIPEVTWKQEHDLAYEKLGPDKQAAYREAHPKYDALLSLKESPSREERLRILSKYPDLMHYEVSLYDYANVTEDDFNFEEMLKQGVIKMKDTPQIEKEYASAMAQVFGGVMRVGDYSQAYPGDLARRDAEKAKNTAVREAKKTIRAAAAAVFEGDPKRAKAKADFWIDKVENTRSDGSFVLPVQLEQWARKHKINPQLLNIGAIEDKWDEHWGSEPKYQPQEASQQALEMLPGFVAVQVIDPRTAEQMAAATPYAGDIKKAGLQLQVDNRKALLDSKMEESFKLDSVDLQRMGYDAGAAFDRAQADVENFYYSKGEYGWYKAKGESTTAEGREARNRFYAYRDKRMKGVKGGEAVIGGLTQTLKMDKYFSDAVPGGSFGYGPSAEKDQKLWNAYVAESLKAKPDPKKILAYKRQFDEKLKDRYETRMRVNDWIAATAVASYMRSEMKSSWSDYYEGPGNSVYTNMGKQMVARLEKLMKSFFTDEQGEVRKESLFYEDIKTYFGDEHTVAYRMLEWYYH